MQISDGVGSFYRNGRKANRKIINGCYLVPLASPPWDLDT